MSSRELYLEKLNSWPRAKDSGDLAPLLSGVRPAPEPGYLYRAVPVCHDSRSGESFHFGDHPAGGVVMGCWACGSGGTLVSAVEEALGVAIQVRWPGGQLRYRVWDGAAVLAGAVSPAVAQAVPGPQVDGVRVRPICALPMPGGTSFSRLLELPLWIPAYAKRPASSFSGVWRQSKPPDQGGVRLARFGGILPEYDGALRRRPVRVLPWRPWGEVSSLVSGRSRGLRPGTSPAFCLSGDLETPAPHDFAVLDFDFRPESAGAGERDIRAALWRALRSAGVPTFRSSSGEGFHGLCRLSAVSLETGWPLPQRVSVPGLPGAAVDLVPPGSRRMVNIRRERFLPGAGEDDPVPVFSCSELESLLVQQGFRVR